MTLTPRFKLAAKIAFGALTLLAAWLAVPGMPRLFKDDLPPKPNNTVRVEGSGSIGIGGDVSSSTISIGVPTGTPSSSSAGARK